MAIELWGIGGPFSLGLPLRLSGYAWIAALLLGLLAVIVRARGTPAPTEAKPSGIRQASLFLALAVAAPLLARSLLLSMDIPSASPAPGLPAQSTGLTIALLGDLPWLLAAGLIGGRSAVLVGMAAGLAQGGWETGSVLTPLQVALQAGAVALLLRNPYHGWLASSARQPLVAAVLGSSLGAVGRVAELFFHSAAPAYDGLAFALSAAGPLAAASLGQALVAGVAASAFEFALPEYWYRPTHRISAPYNRSLAARMVSLYALVGVLGFVLVVGGEWVVARSAAVDLVQAQMQQGARQAAAGVPIFIQSGRSFVRGLADEVSVVGAGPESEALLADRLRRVPFFSRLALYDVSGHLTASAPAGSALVAEGLEAEAAILAALAGVPQELAQAPEAVDRGVLLVFFSPVVTPDSGTVVGALAGWADLQANPFLRPVSASLAATTSGEAFLIDETGRVLLDPGGGHLLELFALDPRDSRRLLQETAADGTRRLVWVEPVEGYSWSIVVRAGQSTVDRLALQIAARLSAVLLGVGLVLLTSIYVISRRLTRPLRVMASIAESIAHGNLGQPVPFSGEDELGRLAASFERMRVSLRSRLEEMDLLLAVSQRVAGSLHLDEVLPMVLEGVRQVTRADHVRLVLEPDLPAEPQAGDLFSAGVDPGRWSSIDTQVLHLAREHGRFALENPTRARAVLDLERLARPMKALLGIPIRHETEFLGALWLGYRRPHAFSKDEVNLLSILTGQVGVAVSNSRHFAQAEEERSRLGAVLQATPDAVFAIDQAGRILLSNPAAEAVWGGEAASSRGAQIEDRITNPDLLGLLRAAPQEGHTAEIRVEGGRVLFAAVSDVRPGGGDPIGRVCVMWDITHYKKLDMLKSEFVSTVSHDLRSPLTLMRGYATMLSMVGSTNEQQREFVRKILDSVDQMARLIDSLLDLGRIEAGVGLNLERTPLEPLVDEVMASLRPQATNKQIALRVDMADPMEPIEVDPTLFRQAVANLVENAIKYTPPGGQVTVRAYQNDGRQTVRVEDTGLGIAPTDQARLFERFFRARRKETLREKGSGLGLAIVKSIAEQHGGRVGVESRLGAGSAFTLEVPILQAPRLTP